MQGIILKDDSRYQYTERYLINQGHTFTSTATKDTRFIIFPFMAEIDQALYNHQFFASLTPGTIIFSGLRRGYLVEKCQEFSLPYHILTQDTGVQIKNATPTSEGVIAYLIANSHTTIADSNLLVIGYGICGSNLARRLKALGANVHALVRNREKSAAAIADGITPIYQHQLLDTPYHSIINTVPSTVLTPQDICQLPKTMLIDIASKPYGFDMAYAQTIHPKSALLPGIPGKYAIKTAGEILGEYIHITLGGHHAHR